MKDTKYSKIWNSMSLFAISTTFKMNISILHFFLASHSNSLTHFSPMSHFCTPWKRQKSLGFLTFSGGIAMCHWTKMGKRLHNKLIMILMNNHIQNSFGNLYMSIFHFDYFKKKVYGEHLSTVDLRRPISAQCSEILMYKG